LAAVEGDDRAAAGLAHLQAAAREAIAAARAFLDVAEDLVADPAAVSAVADAVGSVVRAAAAPGRGAGGDDDRDDDRDDDHGGVEHIRLS
jgi:hypothetical protein